MRRACVLFGLMVMACRPTAPPVASGAPVDVAFELHGAQARVTVGFKQAASDVQISLTGADGLEVVNQPARAQSVSRGASLIATGTVTGAGSLVVTTEGRFGNGVQQRVVNFRVGATPAATGGTQ